ncbi:MAG: P-II family nitrogen regulator [Leptolyngbyaceae cyanobacterium bins.59]|nr:P-II family nitrogen regulator [Leptolyngbyaceae cyanobacterium bins.59]
MHAVKKIEIIASALELPKILEGLNQSGVRGHAVIHNVTGQSLQEGREDFDMTMLDNSVYIIAFCMPEQIKPVVEHIRPLLNKFGGTCYLSDVTEIRSINCVASL